MDTGFDFFGISFETVLGLFISFIIFSGLFNFIKFLIDGFNERLFQKKKIKTEKNNIKNYLNQIYLQKMRRRTQRVKQISILIYYPYLIFEYYLYLLRNNWKIIFFIFIILFIVS